MYKRSLWQRKALKGSRLRLLIWGVLAAFLVVVFSRGHLHELYKLLTTHFQEFTVEEQSATLNAIRCLPAPAERPDPPRALRYIQRQWLSAISGRGSQEADDWYTELSADPFAWATIASSRFRSFYAVQIWVRANTLFRPRDCGLCQGRKPC